MIAAIDAYDVMPGEIKPTGANLAVPEKGIRAGVDSNHLEVNQESPIDAEHFLKVSAGLAELAQKHFGPIRVETSLFQGKMLVPINTEAAAEAAMLTAKGAGGISFGKDLDMTLRSHHWNTTFESGSQRLQIALYPVAFETVRIQRYNPVLGATPSQVQRAKRLTAGAERVPKYAPYAILLEVTMIERDPALSTEAKLFSVFMQKAEIAQKAITIK